MPEVRFGPYTLVKRIAVGGMAEVFLARTSQPSLDEYVVVKQILPQLAEQPELLQLFFDEARIASRIFHPGIVRILDVGEHGGVHFLAMEYVDGLDLSQLMRIAREETGDFPLPCALRIAIDLARAAHFAHEAKEPDGTPLEIVHRDVSPQNVLISKEGEVKLGDFGIARARIRARRTATGILRGKIAYVSPEQYLGNRGDRRVDVFAIGVVLFEMIAGRRPFVGDEAVIIKEVMSKDAPLLSSIVPAVDPRIEAIVALALARAPERRFASAQAFADALDALGMAGDQASLALLARRAFVARERARAEAEKPPERVVRPTMTLPGPNEATPLPPRRPTETLPGPNEATPFPPRRPTETLARAFDAPLAEGPSPLPKPLNVLDTPVSISIHAFSAEPETVLQRPPAAEKTEKKQALSAPVLRRSWSPRAVLLTLMVMGLLCGWILSSWRGDGDAALLGRRIDDGARAAPEPIRAVPEDEPSVQAIVPWTPPPPAPAPVPEEKPVAIQNELPEGDLPEGDVDEPDEPAAQERTVSSVPEVHLTPKRARQRRHVVRRPVAVAAVPAPSPVSSAPPPPPPPEPMQQGEGELSLDTDPWSNVIVDRRELGVTPLAHVRIPAGRHRVRLENPERGLIQTVTLTIKPDEHVAVRVNLADGKITRH